jgi:hypothetical protein
MWRHLRSVQAAMLFHEQFTCHDQCPALASWKRMKLAPFQSSRSTPMEYVFLSESTLFMSTCNCSIAPAEEERNRVSFAFLERDQDVAIENLPMANELITK